LQIQRFAAFGTKGGIACGKRVAAVWAIFHSASLPLGYTAIIALINPLVIGIELAFYMPFALPSTLPFFVERKKNTAHPKSDVLSDYVCLQKAKGQLFAAPCF